MSAIGKIKRRIYRSVKSDTDDIKGHLKRRLSSPGYLLRKAGKKESSVSHTGYDKNWAENADKYIAYRERYKGLVVGITGSVGKTTTKQYTGKVLAAGMSTFVSPSNFNRGMHLAKNMETRMNGRYKAFVQECGADVPGTVENMAKMLRPDIAVVTNVKAHHLSEYGTIENVFADKIQMADQVAPGGTALVNMDDEMLAAYDFKCKTVSYGIECDADVDYRAVNVEQQGGVLSFDILHDGESIHVRSTVIGKENAYNILVAFIIGELAGIDRTDILEAIAAFRTHGTRQNLVEYGGYTLYMDCYNVTNDTIVAAIQNLSAMDVAEGSRRIAVIGGENRLGDRRREATKELGERVAAAAKGKIDEVICYGNPSDEEEKLNWYGDAPLLYETIKSEGFENVRLIRDFDEIVGYIQNEVHPGDAVLFKCIVYLNMPIAVDKALGTYFSISQRIVTKHAEPMREGSYEGFIVPDMDEAYIKEADSSLLRAKSVTIPDSFGGKPVFGVSRGLFAYADMESLDLGSSIKQIGTGAFRGCRNLKSVRIPDSVMHIKEGAFNGCSKLEEVTIGRGMIQIDDNAFAGCDSLKSIIFEGETKPAMGKGVLQD